MKRAGTTLAQAGRFIWSSWPRRTRVACVLTCNAETNHHMVDINERLGFEAVEVCPMLEPRIDNAVPAPTEQRAQVSAATTDLR